MAQPARRARQALFYPMRVARGPLRGTHLVRIRRATGVDIGSLRKFEMIDDWAQPSNAHWVLPFTSEGTSEFHVVRDAMVNFNVDGRGRYSSRGT